MTYVNLEDALGAIGNLGWHRTETGGVAGTDSLSRHDVNKALRALPTVSDGWEDIATANKEEMILGHADGMVRLVMWESGMWLQVGATIEPGWFEPTEWKPLGPLPSPPSE